MLRPFLLVGVGGSGGKTLRAMRQSLLRRIRQVGWQGDGLPRGWQMLWVDSVSVQSPDGFPDPLLPGTDYCGLVQPGTSYQALRASLTMSAAASDRMSATAGWVAEQVPINVEDGAGQSRAIGRVISAARLSQIRTALARQHGNIAGPTVQAELADLASRLGLQPGPVPVPIALVISSVAGGTGSAMFLDVVEALRSVDPVYNHQGGIVTILYTPDVFASVGQTRGVPPNTLATLAEVLTGVWSNGLSDASSAVYSGQGLFARAAHGFGSKCNFLVGASNANVSLGSQEDVYRAVGESLSAMVIDDKIMESFVAFYLTNVVLKTGNAENVEDRSGLRSPGNDLQTMPFAALGMGRVNLGADRFRQYVTTLVGRDIAETLLWPEFAPRDPANPKPSEQLIDEQVAVAWDPFRQASGLDERDPANQVIDALVDKAAQDQRLAAWAQKGVTQARAGVDGRGMGPEEWLQRFLSYYSNFLPSARAEEEAQRYQLAQQWTSSIQERLERLVLESCLRYGYQVTTRLLETLVAEVVFATDELKQQATTLRTQAQEVESRIMQQLNVGKTKLPADDTAHVPADVAVDVAVDVPVHVLADDAAVTAVGQLMAKGAGIEVSADRALLAAALLEDARQGLLLPLLEGVQAGLARLSNSVHQAQMLDGRRNPWPVQPRYDEPVPTWLHPGGTERVLIQPGDYQDILGTQTRNALTDPNEQQVWRQVLRTRIALGQALGSGEDLGTPVMTRTGAWTPRDPRACATTITGQQAAITLPESFEDFAAAVDTWLADPQLASDLGRFMTQGLKAYVESGTPQQQVQRQNDLIAALTAAVNIAAPLVNVKQGVVSALHPNVDPDGRQIFVTTIPFPPGHPLHDPIRAVFRDGKVLTPRSEALSSWWFATAKVDDISVFTMSGYAMLPMAFDNLMIPIAQSWAQASTNEAQRYSFYRLRRARPLIECIPAGPEQVDAMIRGWFLGRVLGQVTRTDERGLGWRVEVWNPDPPYNGPQPFPFPLLSDEKVHPLDLLPAVLQSLPLAMVEVHTSTSLAPLVPYQRLIALGEQHQTLLRDWIDHATLEPGAPTPTPEVAGTPDQDPQARRDTIHAGLTSARDQFTTLFEAAKRENDPHKAPLAWELRTNILTAIDQLTTAAEPTPLGRSGII